jgi:hypothetical protein
MRVQSFKQLVTAMVIALAGVAVAAGPKHRVNKTSDGLAVKGYDVVAYAVDGTAIKGSPQFQHTWNDAVWRFASAANRERFIANPDRYAPQFGGYCSWAVSRNYTADVDPQAWRIVDGRLYLNYSKSVQRRWEQDIPGNISKAQGHWPAVLNQ